MNSHICTGHGSARFSTDELKIPQQLPQRGSDPFPLSPSSLMLLHTVKCSFSQSHRASSLPWNMNSFDLEELPFIYQANSCLSLGLSCAAVSLPSCRGPLRLPFLLPHTSCRVLSPLGARTVQHCSSLVTCQFPMRLHALQRAGTESAFCRCILSTRPGLVEAAVCVPACQGAHVADASPSLRSRAPQQHFLCTPPWRLFRKRNQHGHSLFHRV